MDRKCWPVLIDGKGVSDEDSDKDESCRVDSGSDESGITDSGDENSESGVIVVVSVFCLIVFLFADFGNDGSGSSETLASGDCCWLYFLFLVIITGDEGLVTT